MRILTWAVAAIALLGWLALTQESNVTAGEKDKVLKVGDKVPAFKSTDDQGKTWNSSDVVGKKTVVLYFYPADFTGGCTSQACGFRDDIEKLKGVEIIGVSTDSPSTHKLFKAHHKLPFTLLADEKGEIAKMFAVPVNFAKKTAEGVDENGNKVIVERGASISRFTVVIDKQGNVAAIDQVKDAKGDAKRITELVKKLDK